MIFIDLENKLPTDYDLPNNIRWSSERWISWQRKSDELVGKLSALNDDGKIQERNQLIDNNSGHWTALKPWLLHLSAGKCWFTEAKDSASHFHVEHFRPKKKTRNIKGPERDGYWWLAFDYMNFRIAGSVPNSKKGVWFPLRLGSPCSSYSRRCEADEIPHFLDPTNAHDVTLLAFDEKGEAIPTPGVDRWEYVRARRTIDRLKLSEHPALTCQRRSVWQKVSNQIRIYEQALLSSRTSPAQRERVKAAACTIKSLTRNEEQLSAVARYCVIARNDPKLVRLIG